MSIIYQNMNALLNGLSDVGVIYLAANYAMDGLMTVGVISAFMAYKSQFLGRMSSLVDQGIKFNLLGVQLDRVGDIALAKQEEGMESLALAEPEIVGDVEVRGLSFGYSKTEPPIIRGLNVKIAAGEFVAIVGSSGAGKSTLLKLLIGLIAPTAGDVWIDRREIGSLGLSNFRRQLGVVMQEDQLLAGTICENIALFDDKLDIGRVRQAATLAGIDDEIMRFPMQYNSLVGDMGSSLSSGQKQRVMIARALYRNPKILVLDEGTAHLDGSGAMYVHNVIKSLPMTRIVVAHGEGMIRSADRVYSLANGSLHLQEFKRFESIS